MEHLPVHRVDRFNHLLGGASLRRYQRLPSSDYLSRSGHKKPLPFWEEEAVDADNEIVANIDADANGDTDIDSSIGDKRPTDDDAPLLEEPRQR